LAPAFTASVYAKWSILFRHYVNDSIEIEWNGLSHSQCMKEWLMLMSEWERRDYPWSTALLSEFSCQPVDLHSSSPRPLSYNNPLNSLPEIRQKFMKLKARYRKLKFSGGIYRKKERERLKSMGNRCQEVGRGVTERMRITWVWGVGNLWFQKERENRVQRRRDWVWKIVGPDSSFLCTASPSNLHSTTKSVSPFNNKIKCTFYQISVQSQNQMHIFSFDGATFPNSCR
jgi:hypothetical protein